MQKKKANIEQLTAVIKKYKVVGSFFFVSCILEFFDKVVLIQNSQSLSLVNHSVNSVRSYTSSTNYRNIVSIVDDDKVTFCSILGLDSLNHKPAFPKNPVPVNGFEPMIDEKQGKDLPF